MRSFREHTVYRNNEKGGTGRAYEQTKADKYESHANSDIDNSDRLGDSRVVQNERKEWERGRTKGKRNETKDASDISDKNATHERMSTRARRERNGKEPQRKKKTKEKNELDTWTEEG